MTSTKEEFEQNDMSILFSTKESIDFTKKIAFKDEGKEINKIVFIPGSSIRKVLITDKVQYKYIKQLNRIIEANKDVIVKVKNKISLRGISVIEVDSIEKLLAVQNELRIPIAYFEEIENKKSSFTIVNEKTAWQYKLEVKEDK